MIDWEDTAVALDTADTTIMMSRLDNFDRLPVTGGEIRSLKHRRCATLRELGLVVGHNLQWPPMTLSSKIIG